MPMMHKGDTSVRMRRRLTVRRADILDSMAARAARIHSIGDLATHTGRCPRDILSCLVDLGRLGWTRLVRTEGKRYLFVLTLDGAAEVRICAYHHPRLFPAYIRRLRA